MTSVAKYERWLHREAYRVGRIDHDDLVQEGRIAMWKQEIKHGGEHAGFMTNSAALRMRQVAGGEKAFGGIKVAVRDVAPDVSLDQFEPTVVGRLSPEQTDLAEQAMMAYHHGAISQAINRLPERQRQATLKILTDGAMTPQERAAWTVARQKLAAELAEMRDECL